MIHILIYIYLQRNYETKEWPHTYKHISYSTNVNKPQKDTRQIIIDSENVHIKYPSYGKIL